MKCFVLLSSPKILKKYLVYLKYSLVVLRDNKYTCCTHIYKDGVISVVYG